jgi:ribosome maturation factor RimP
MERTLDAASDRLRAVVSRIAESYGLDIFEVQFRRESHGWVLRVILDRPARPEDPAAQTAVEHGESVTIDDCRRVSEDLSARLDVEPELIDAGRNYTLEVSSPGLDRPLRGEADYRRFVGRLAKIVTNEPVGGQSHFAGRLTGVDGDEVVLVEGKRTHRVPFAAIRRARLDVEF